MIGRGTESSPLREQPSRSSEPTNEGSEVNVAYKPSRSKKSQMWSHAKVKRNEEQRLDQDWRDTIRLADAYVDLGDKFIKMLSPFQLMWYGSVSQINSESYRIEQPPADATPINPPPYWADTKHASFGKNIDKMLSERTIEQPETECRTKIAPKIVPYAFASITGNVKILLGESSSHYPAWANVSFRPA